MQTNTQKDTHTHERTRTHTHTQTNAHTNTRSLWPAPQSLLEVLHLKPALLEVYEQLQEVLPLGLTVVLHLEHRLQGVGMGLVHSQHHAAVPRLRPVRLLVQVPDPLAHQVWEGALHGLPGRLHSRAQHPAPAPVRAVARGQVGTEPDLGEGGPVQAAVGGPGRSPLWRLLRPIQVEPCLRLHVRLSQRSVVSVEDLFPTNT